MLLDFAQDASNFIKENKVLLIVIAVAVVILIAVSIFSSIKSKADKKKAEQENANADKDNATSSDDSASAEATAETVVIADEKDSETETQEEVVATEETVAQEEKAEEAQEEKIEESEDEKVEEKEEQQVETEEVKTEEEKVEVVAPQKEKKAKAPRKKAEKATEKVEAVEETKNEEVKEDSLEDETPVETSENVENAENTEDSPKTFPGTVEIYKGKNDFYFNFRASNKILIGRSQGYTTKAACKNGAEAVMNMAKIATIHDSTKDEKPNDYKPAFGKSVFQLYPDKEGKFRWRLYAKNQQNILASKGYSTKANAKSAVQSLKKIAENYVLVDLTKQPQEEK